MELTETELASVATPSPSVSGSIDDLIAKLQTARQFLAGSDAESIDPRGIYYRGVSDARNPGKWPSCFPGQGAQGPDMLIDLALAFPEVRSGFEDVDRALRSLGRTPIGPLGLRAAGVR